MKKSILTLCIMLATGTLQAQETTKFTAGKHNEYGLVYTLPQTVFDIEVTATKTIQKTGPYYKYTEKYLGIPVTITENKEFWTLDNVNVSSYGVPDREQEYMVKFKSGSTPYMYLNKEGLLLAVNTDPVEESTPSAAPAASRKKASPDNNRYASVLTEEMLMSGSTAKMAEMAAKQIYRIRESRMDLSTGDSDQKPADGAALRLMMQQLDEQESSLMAMFLGTTQTEQVTKHFTWTPRNETANEIVFRISDLLGIVEKNDLSGAPVYINLKITEKGEYPLDAKGNVKEMPKNGLAYCIPGKAAIDIVFKGKPVFNGSFQVAQFGIVYGLDPSLFENKKTPSYVTFYPQTGAIREIGQ
ncbi:MAG: DUF4831 family protein [Coprobacter sp.]|nr:DUF4831 family protein [Coprobacter sp.]